MIRQTSMSAYRNTAPKRSSQAGIIARLLAMHPNGLTRQEISAMTHMPINAVTGRVYDLIKDGRVIEYDARVNPVTGQKNMVVRSV